MTARVTSSASLSLGGMPTGGRQGASWGACCSSSSILTYSAVARVSRSASTRPPTRSTLGSNADHGHPRPHAGPLGINRLVGVAVAAGDGAQVEGLVEDVGGDPVVEGDLAQGAAGGGGLLGDGGGLVVADDRVEGGDQDQGGLGEAGGAFAVGGDAVDAAGGEGAAGRGQVGD